MEHLTHVVLLGSGSFGAQDCDGDGRKAGDDCHLSHSSPFHFVNDARPANFDLPLTITRRRIADKNQRWAVNYRVLK